MDQKPIKHVTTSIYVYNTTNLQYLCAAFSGKLEGGKQRDNGPSEREIECQGHVKVMSRSNVSKKESSPVEYSRAIQKAG